MGLFGKILDRFKLGRLHHGIWIYSEFQTFLQYHGADLIELYKTKIIPSLNDILIEANELDIQNSELDIDELIMSRCLENADQEGTEKGWRLAGLACSYFLMKHSDDAPIETCRYASERLDFCMLNEKLAGE